MPSKKDKTLLIPIPLGLADQYPRSVFPLMRFKGQRESLHEVDIALVATMDELVKMKQMVESDAEFKTLIYDSKTQYDELLENKQNLAEAIARKTLNPFKIFSTYRAARLLSEAGMALWTETKSKSEKLRRDALSVDTQDTQPVGDDDLPPNTRISAIAIPVETETQLDDTISFFTEAASFIDSQRDLFPDRNPFSDVYEANDSRTSAVPEDGSGSKFSADGGATSSASLGSRLSEASSSKQGSGNKYFIFQKFQNSYVTSKSAIHTPTLNQGGSYNQGSSSR